MERTMASFDRPEIDWEDGEALLAIVALVALVRDEFPPDPLAELAYIYGGCLTSAHYAALAKVDQWLEVVEACSHRVDASSSAAR